MVNGIIIKKLNVFDTVLEELRSLGKVNAETFKRNWQTQRAVERELQVLVEIVVDVCQRLISIRGESPAASGADAIQRCVALGALSDRAAYKKMVQFRTFIVHRYEAIDVNVLVTMINRNLADFELFREDILAYVQGSRMNQNRTIDFEKIEDIFQKIPSVTAAWIFGSAKDGCAAEGSDLDVGILFSQDPSVNELLDLQGDIQAATGTEDIDMVVLNKANPILAFEVISGTPVFCRDVEKRAGFASLTACEYEDSMCMISDALAQRT